MRCIDDFAFSGACENEEQLILVFAQQCSVVITILFVGLFFFPHLQPQQVANPHLVDVVCGATATGVRRGHSSSNGHTSWTAKAACCFDQCETRASVWPYRHYPSSGCPEKNELGTTQPATLEECAQACTDASTCTSFEHKASNSECLL